MVRHSERFWRPSANDTNFFKLVGSVNADDIYMALSVPMYLGQDRATNPELNIYLTWLDKTHPGDAANLYGFTAWASGVLFVQALEAAGGSPQRDAVINQVNKISSFTANGLAPPAGSAANKPPRAS